MTTPDLRDRAAAILAACRGAGVRLATAESCTGGLIAAILTSLPGASDAVDRGYVTYSNAAKTEMLGVPATLIADHGAVSETVARAMAEGAVARAGAGLAVAVTGIAGPGGGTPRRPAGLVHLACARRGGPTTHRREVFAGDRDAVRRAAAAAALDLLAAALGIGPRA